MTKPETPRTKAGQRLLDELAAVDPEPPGPGVRAAILAIEEEAAAPDDGEALRAALLAIVTEALVYREDATTPECYMDSGPYCGVHSFLEYSGLIDNAASLLGITAKGDGT